MTAKRRVKIAKSLLRHLNGAIFTHYLGNKIHYYKTLKQPFFNQDHEMTIELQVTKKKKKKKKKKTGGGNLSVAKRLIVIL